jgi:hypothetical protein
MARHRVKQKTEQRKRADKRAARRSIERVRRYEKQQLLEEVKKAAEAEKRRVRAAAARKATVEAKKAAEMRYGGKEQCMGRQASCTMVLRIVELHASTVYASMLACMLFVPSCPPPSAISTLLTCPT